MVAFVGPSLPTAEAATLLPAARIEPPARRGDLYRARNRGASVLVVVDGQFLQEDALPPREVIDVAGDGALVYGAASIGALRAAECGPVGVRGVGLIFRLFRAGVLESDDEVAVATDRDQGFRAISVALVNVRYAATRAVRAGLLDRATAAGIIECARRLFYPDRTWTRILDRAGCADRPGLVEFCTGIDLKADDTRKVLLVAGRSESGGTGSRRPGSAPLDEKERQRLPDALMGRSPGDCAPGLARWMVGAGRCPRERPPVAMTPAGAWAAVKADDPAFARWLWNRLEARGDLEAELMRWYAVDEAAAQFQRRGLRVRAVDRYLAEAEIAARYLCASWDELERRADELGVPWGWLDEAAERLARAKGVRAALMNPPSLPVMDSRPG